MTKAHFHDGLRGIRWECRREDCRLARAVEFHEDGLTVAQTVDAIVPDVLRVVRGQLRKDFWLRWLKGPKPYHLGGKRDE